MRITILAAASAVAVAAGVLTTQTVASAETDDALKVRETFTRTLVQDVGKKGTSIGDRLAFTTQIRDIKGRKVGIGAGECVLLRGTSDANALYHCTQTYRLGSDSLLAAGIYEPTKKIRWAVMGGTGKYRGASGETDGHAVNATTFASTFHLGS